MAYTAKMTVSITTEKPSFAWYSGYIGVGMVVPSITAVKANTSPAKAVPRSRRCIRLLGVGSVG